MVTPSEISMRLLVGCTICNRQYEIYDGAPGTSLQCWCGTEITVPRARACEASVVRCSSCGAARAGGDNNCRFCQSSFTLNERDLHTICPRCFARISDSASYCHHCGTPILIIERPNESFDYSCPTCESGSKLTSVSLAEGRVSAMECRKCLGLWIDKKTFDFLAREAQAAAPPAIVTQRPSLSLEREKQSGPMYRYCIICRRMMNRTNYARSSGVIIDVCTEHGVWFDKDELTCVLTWLRQGGWHFAQSQIQQRPARSPTPALAWHGPSSVGFDFHFGADGLTFIIKIISAIVGRLGR